MNTTPPFGQACVERLPEPVRREAFSVAGVGRRFAEATQSEIPGLWQELEACMPFAGQVGWETYGVISNVDHDDGAFDYTAAGRLDPGAAVPPGLSRLDLPAATYAVFSIVMGGGPPHPQVKAAMQRIWTELVPQAGLRVLDAPKFELYEGDVRLDRPGAIIDYYVPIET